MIPPRVLGHHLEDGLGVAQHGLAEALVHVRGDDGSAAVGGVELLTWGFDSNFTNYNFREKHLECFKKILPEG